MIRPAWLLVRLRLRRMGHMLSAGLAGFKRSSSKPEATTTRSAEAGKRAPAWLVPALFAPLMLFSAFQISHAALRNLGRVIPAGTGTEALAIAGVVSLLWLAYFLLSIASRGELSAASWDLVWLATLPVPTSSLLVARIAERAVVHAFGYILVLPILTMLAWNAGWRWWAPVVGVVGSGLLFVLGAALRTGVETWLRLHLNQAALRNVQAALTVGGLVPMYLAMSLGTGGGLDPSFFLYDWLVAVPSWMAWTPFGLVVDAATSLDPAEHSIAFALLFAEVAFVVVATVAGVQRLLRHGFVAGGSRESSRIESPRGRSSGLAWLSPLQRKELRLLARDRTFLMQTLLVPVVVVVAQYLINPAAFAGALDNPRVLGAAVFGIGAYTLCFSALQTLNAEGQVLWMLFAAPIRIDRVVIEKGLFWGGIVTFWPAAMLVALVAGNGSIGLSGWSVAALVAVGLPIYGVIASCLGVFACRPFEKEKNRRIEPSWLYLFLLLSSLHTWAIFAETMWATTASLVLSCLLALALWQKASDRLPYLLDPTAAPPPSVSLSDGLIAAQAFFVLQGVTVLVIRAASGDGPLDAATPDKGRILLVAFCVAGAATWGIARLLFWRSKTAGVPALLGNTTPRNLAFAVMAGLGASAAGGLWLGLVRTSEVFPAAWRELATTAPHPGWWLIGLAVVAAPLFEEFIFRGLVFGGLRRSFGTAPSVLASAAIFAIVHPPISVAPVFMLGCVTAITYARVGRLWAPMLVHGIYNAAVVALPQLT